MGKYVNKVAWSEYVNKMLRLFHECPQDGQSRVSACNTGSCEGSDRLVWRVHGGGVRSCFFCILQH